jgi:vacuolar-type H+-ATPase subunit E/Vma4
MALEQILDKISEEANQEAKSILEDASKKVGQILEEARKEAVLLKDKTISTGKAKEEFFCQKEVIAKRLESQKNLLQIKRTLLNYCFQEALRTLHNLDYSSYRNFISNMLAKINLKEEAGVVFSNSDKSRIAQDYIHEINPRFELSFSDKVKDGFILKTKDLIIDNSLQNILAGLQQILEPQVAQILFQES